MEELDQKKVLFLTGTRADYGKIKAFMKEVDENPELDCRVFATGMHTLERYGFTVEEIRKDGFEDIYMYVNQIIGEPMDMVLANTIHGLSRYVHDSPPDLIILHGDRVEALAGAIVGSLRNIHTVHIEGGEVSGTADEIMRHAITKLSHSHFVANEEAKARLVQMGEQTDNIYITGSPDIDIMLSDDLPELCDVKSYYDIDYPEYAISIYHPVTTELDTLGLHIKSYVDALVESKQNVVVIFPNNDEGTDIIQNELERLQNNRLFRCLPSMKFEAFLTLLKNAKFIIGNSSAAIREAPVYGVPTINIGSRQDGRYDGKTIINTSHDYSDILSSITKASKMDNNEVSTYFGSGNSRKLFSELLRTEAFWKFTKQKKFIDLDLVSNVKSIKA